MSDFIPTIVFAIIATIFAYFTGLFRGKSKVKELKVENQIKKKIIEQEEKMEQKNQEREALYDKVRETLGNRYTSKLMHPNPKSGSVQTEKAVLFPNRRALQKRPTSRTARFTATHPKPAA